MENYFLGYTNPELVRKELETEIFDKILNNQYIHLSLIEDLNILNSDKKLNEVINKE